MLGAQDPSPGGACLPLCGSTWGSLQWVWKHRPPEWVSSPNGLSARLTHILRLQITNLTERGEFGLVFKNHHFHSTSQAANHKYSWHRSKPGGGRGGTGSAGFRSPASRAPAPALTASVLRPLHPRERDGPFPAALAEAQQERARLLVLEQRALSLLADKAHDAPACGEPTGALSFCRAARVHVTDRPCR